MPAAFSFRIAFSTALEMVTESPVETPSPAEQAPPKIPALFTPAFPLQKRPWAGALVMGHIIFSVLALSAFVFPPLFVLLWLPVPAKVRQVAQRALDHVVGAWFESMGCIFEVVCGISLRATGFFTHTSKERALFIMNHPTLLDWAFLWLWLIRFGDLSCLKIVLKEQVARYPILGWPCQMISFLFLTREWARDEPTVSALVSYWRRNDRNANVLIFPEGTNLTGSTAARGTAFCLKEGKKPYLHVLPPRTTGFAALYALLTEAGQIDAVYDFTIAYAPAPVSKEVHFIKGDMPHTVHIHCHRTPVAEMPHHTDVPGLCKWLWSRFDVKENMLARFYSELHSGNRIARLGASESDLEVGGLGYPIRRKTTVALGLATWAIPVALAWLSGASALVWGWYVLWNAAMIGLVMTQGTALQKQSLNAEQQAIERDTPTKTN